MKVYIPVYGLVHMCNQVDLIDTDTMIFNRKFWLPTIIQALYFVGLVMIFENGWITS